jgi:hypothetical protein
MQESDLIKGKRTKIHNYCRNIAHQTMYDIDETGRVLEIIIPKDLRQGVVNNAKESYGFKFTEVFDQMST